MNNVLDLVEIVSSTSLDYLLSLRLDQLQTQRLLLKRGFVAHLHGKDVGGLLLIVMAEMLERLLVAFTNYNLLQRHWVNHQRPRIYWNQIFLDSFLTLDYLGLHFVNFCSCVNSGIAESCFFPVLADEVHCQHALVHHLERELGLVLTQLLVVVDHHQLLVVRSLEVQDSLL